MRIKWQNYLSINILHRFKLAQRDNLQLRFAELLTDEETRELKSLILHSRLKQFELLHLVGVKHQSSLSKMLGAKQAKARFRTLLELLRLRQNVTELKDKIKV